ncbi:hypothetical protein [Pelagibaculum spongiae]|nr:hypothetical protein [Pelagibaculum spongiae]
MPPLPLLWIGAVGLAAAATAIIASSDDDDTGSSSLDYSEALNSRVKCRTIVIKYLVQLHRLKLEQKLNRKLCNIDHKIGNTSVSFGSDGSIKVDHDDLDRTLKSICQGIADLRCASLDITRIVDDRFRTDDAFMFDLSMEQLAITTKATREYFSATDSLTGTLLSEDDVVAKTLAHAESCYGGHSGFDADSDYYSPSEDPFFVQLKSKGFAEIDRIIE